MCDNICFKGKNLYNYTNYLIRQHYFKYNKWIGQKELWNQLKHSDCYSDFGHTTIAMQVFRDVFGIWKSYFESTKSYDKTRESYNGKPQIPCYKHKESGRFQVCYTLCGNAPAIGSSYIKTNIATLRGKDKINIVIPEYIKGKKIKEILIVPKSSHYSIMINYEDIMIEQSILDDTKYASIDLGVNNLIALTSNFNKPYVVNGRPIKSINQYYNKKLTKLRSKLYKDQYSSIATRRLTRKRNNKIKTECHRITKYVVDYLVKNRIKTLIIGRNIGWKQSINIDKVNNQKFVSIPFNMIIKQIQYKFEVYGGVIRLQEESYTSKASFIDLDQIPIYSKKQETNHQFSGKRIKRGLYKTKNKICFNADVNGSYNIMRKAVPNVFDNGIEGVVLHPLLITINTNGLLV